MILLVFHPAIKQCLMKKRYYSLFMPNAYSTNKIFRLVYFYYEISISIIFKAEEIFSLWSMYFVVLFCCYNHIFELFFSITFSSNFCSRIQIRKFVSELFYNPNSLYIMPLMQITTFDYKIHILFIHISLGKFKFPRCNWRQEGLQIRIRILFSYIWKDIIKSWVKLIRSDPNSGCFSTIGSGSDYYSRSNPDSDINRGSGSGRLHPDPHPCVAGRLLKYAIINIIRR